MLSAKKSISWLFQERRYYIISFVKYIWKSTVDHQSPEIERVLTNESAEYRLSEEAQYLAIPTEVWNQWSYEDRMKYIKFVGSLGKNNIENQKTIDTVNWENKESDLQPAKKTPVDETLRVFTKCSTRRNN